MFLVASFIFIFNLLIKLLKIAVPYQEYISLIVTSILIAIRYLSFEFTFAVFIDAMINIILCLLLALSLEKVRYSYEHKFEDLKIGYKFMAISVIYALFLRYEIVNLFSLSLITLFLIKLDMNDVVFADLFIVVLYNYFYFNISFELLLIYVFALGLSSINNKISPIIFMVITNSFYVVKYPNFYLDIGFYLNALIVGIYYLIPNQLLKRFSGVFPGKLDRLSSLEQEISLVNNQVNQVKEYLSLLKINPVEEKNIRNELAKNIERNLCNYCKNKESCAFVTAFNNYVIRNINKEEKIQILNLCFYPYKLIKRIDMAYKSYLYQIEIQENKIINRDTFNYQIDTILKPLNNKNVNPKAINNNFFLDYEVITSGYSKFNGDTHRVLNDSNKTFVVLSDGMGHNKIANQISSYLVELFTSSYRLTKNEKETIQNINAILKTKVSDEIYATLDLASFDLVGGEVNLFKAGSFSTFLVRNGELTHFNKVFPPLGIIDRVDIFEENIQIEENDCFIFMSDGFGEEVRSIVEETVDLVDKIPLSDYTQNLYNELTANKIEDDKTLLIVKVGVN